MSLIFFDEAGEETQSEKQLKQRGGHQTLLHHSHAHRASWKHICCQATLVTSVLLIAGRSRVLK